MDTWLCPLLALKLSNFMPFSDLFYSSQNDFYVVLPVLYTTMTLLFLDHFGA